jgi:hypothetical protein
MKKLIKKILCRIGLHIWETVNWKSDEAEEFLDTVRIVKTVNLRTDKCKRCVVTQTVKDNNAALVKSIKELAWKERRRVVIEKHKNPKLYAYRVTMNDFVWDMRIDSKNTLFREKVYSSIYS